MSGRETGLEGKTPGNFYSAQTGPDMSTVSSSGQAGVGSSGYAQRKMSPRRTLTAASSSGSDPLASPSNEAMSDIEGPMLDSSMYPGLSGPLTMSGISSAAQLQQQQRMMMMPPAAAGIQAQLMTLEKQYQLQKDLLNRQFEEQRRQLEQEQQAQIHDYFKRMMLQKKQEELCEQQQRKLQEEEQRMKERCEAIKHKRKDEESAVASAEVKLRLRECLLSKTQRECANSGDSSPEYRNWSSQHGSLEQHSPPTVTEWSPPLNLTNKFDDEYPLRKTVSEPSLKMRNSKLSLRQKVMQRNSQLMRKREMYHRRIPLTDHDDSPNSPPTVVSSQGSSVDMGILEEEPRAYDGEGGMVEGVGGYRGVGPLDGQGGLCNNFSNPDISGIRRHPLHHLHHPISDRGKPSPPGMSISQGCDTDPRRVRPGHYDPSHHVYPMMHYPTGMGMGMIGAGPLHPPQVQAESASMTEAYVQALIMARSALPRTQSEPIPLPVQLLLQQHQMLLQKQQEQQLRESNKMYLKQKLLQNASAKKMMENVDEAAETRLMQDLNRESSAESVDVIVVDDPKSSSSELSSRPMSKSRRAFLEKNRARTLSGSFSSALAASGGMTEVTEEGVSPGGKEEGDKPSLERGHSCPTSESTRQFSPDTAGKILHKTGLVYDPTMLKHSCLCQDTIIHPENPARLVHIWSRLEETGLVDKCTLVKSRRAKREELQTCHSEAYVQMYATSQRHTNPIVFERFASRFCRLACGGIGVDADTVWNEQHTTMAARVAAGSVIELSQKVCSGEVENGFALVRPPGHHAEDTQAMGFCYFNSIGVATKLLLERMRMKRLLIVDWDVHHGNSTQQLFYTDPRVLYISLHRHDDGNFFPGTGFPGECGIDRGLGYNVNISWSGAPMGDAEYMAAFRTVVLPIARDYNPEMILVSAGFDAALGHPNPLGGYRVSPQCFGWMTQQLLGVCEGRVVLVLEGGYEISPLVQSAELCLRALLNEQIELPAESELYRSPCKEALENLTVTIQHQLPYWSCLARHAQTIGWSYLESQHRLKEEAETVSAFAGLSVMSSGQNSNIQDRPDSTTADIAEEQEPMEDT